jgi:nucleoside-diphosphate-sugar epimerase
MILLTGASGFIGQHLLASLIKLFGRDNILAFTSKPIEECNYLLHNNYSFEEDLFTKNGYADRIDTVIHAGAFTPKNSSQANDWKNCNQNIYNLDRLLNTYLPKLNKIVYLSTLDVYGETELITEESIVSPSSLYGYSKLYGERLVYSWAKANNVNAQVLRVGHVYGSGEESYQKIIPVTMKKLLHNEAIELYGDGSDLRAFIYIDNIVDAIIKSLTLETDIGIVNLVSNNSISIKELVQLIVKVSGREAAIKTLPQSGGPRNLRFDNSKMKKYLVSDETPLLDGLKSEWSYMLNLYNEHLL